MLQSTLDGILNSLKVFQPEITLTVVLCLILILDLILKNRPKIIAWSLFVGLLITGYFLIQQTNGLTISAFENMFLVDPFSVYFRMLIILTSIFIVMFSMMSGELYNGKRKLGEYYIFVASATLGMFLMSGAGNLLMMYLAIELTSLSFYILSGYKKEVPDSNEASLKYLIYGAVSSGMMLYGISIIYGLTGSLDFININKAFQVSEVSFLPLVAANILMLVGFGFKISAVPFHFWTPDVYEGAPITITAFLSVASKAAGFAVLMRYFFTAYYNPVASALSGSIATLSGFDWNIIIAIISVATMTIGNFIAIWQTNLKRLLAYSSIAHAGYMLMGIVVLSNEGIAAILIYFAVYLFMNLGAFYIVMLIADKIGSEDIESYKGLGYKTPFMAVVLSIFLISLTGLPPTAGFIGKLYLFAALINHQWIWLAIVGVLNSVVSLYYYVKVFRNMFLKNIDEQHNEIKFNAPQIIVALLLVIPTLVFGLYFSPLVNLAQASVSILGLK
ncbi:MAG: NADH-ubiquinone oxidoreductase chain N [Ignavibacteriae bacterium]|nr:MAG: NADH-ubiquinone oxidoreductase chain N [Ignavibacteriota bacterium]